MPSPIARCPHCGKNIYGPSISWHAYYSCRKYPYRIDRLKIKRTQSTKNKEKLLTSMT